VQLQVPQPHLALPLRLPHQRDGAAGAVVVLVVVALQMDRRPDFQTAL